MSMEFDGVRNEPDPKSQFTIVLHYLARDSMRWCVYLLAVIPSWSQTRQGGSSMYWVFGHRWSAEKPHIFSDRRIFSYHISCMCHWL